MASGGGRNRPGNCSGSYSGLLWRSEQVLIEPSSFVFHSWIEAEEVAERVCHRLGLSALSPTAAAGGTSRASRRRWFYLIRIVVGTPVLVLIHAVALGILALVVIRAQFRRAVAALRAAGLIRDPVAEARAAGAKAQPRGSAGG